MAVTDGSLVRAGILSMLALITLGQHAVFQNDLKLWGNAERHSPTAPRPAYNLGVLWRQQGEYGVATTMFVLAGERTDPGPSGDAMRRKVRAQLEYLVNLGYPACEQPSAQRFCS